MFRESWKYTFPDKEESDAEETALIYEEIMEAIDAEGNAEDAIQWGRLYGGAIILIGVIDGRTMDKPLIPASIRSFDGLRVIDRTDIEYDKIEFQMDPSKPRYGLPEYYPIQFTRATGVKEVQRAHYSRVIEVHSGTRVPKGAEESLKDEYRYWGISVLQPAYDNLAGLGEAMGGVYNGLNEFSIGKYKLGDLAEILSTKDGPDLIKKRVEVMDMTRSMFHAMYFDKEDDFIRDKVDFSGVPEVLYIIFMLIAASTGYPITRLFGVSPAGMNATGESDRTNYYDIVRAAQRKILKPILLRLVKIIAEWQGIDEPYIEFNPLLQLSDLEKATLEKTQADKDGVIAATWKSYLDMGVLNEWEIRYLQFGDSLKDIPDPPEEELPAVETVPEQPPENATPAVDEEGNPVDETADPANKDPENVNETGEESNGNADPANEPEEDSDAELDAKIAEMDEEAITDRIKELEEKEERTEDEETELEKLKKRLAEIEEENGEE
jgi:phage-related protein (TIGR01555 family)